MCLLHTNELPWRHVFATLVGASSGSDTFAGSISKKIQGRLSSWIVTQFMPIFVPSFPSLLLHVVDDLSTDQHYGYKICLAVVTGIVDDDLQYMAVGPVVHSRSLTLGCQILRYYVSVDELSQSLEIFVSFCLTVYFLAWFEVKLYHQISHGSKNLFNLIQRINSLSNEDLQQIALNVFWKKEYFAHPERFLTSMLGNNDEARMTMTIACRCQ